MPATIQLSGTSCTTTELGAIVTLLPTLTLPNTFALNPIKQLSPITGTSVFDFCPMHTPGYNVTLLPIFALLFTIHQP